MCGRRQAQKSCLYPLEGKYGAQNRIIVGRLGVREEATGPLDPPVEGGGRRAGRRLARLAAGGAQGLAEKMCTTLSARARLACAEAVSLKR